MKQMLLIVRQRFGFCRHLNIFFVFICDFRFCFFGVFYILNYDFLYCYFYGKCNKMLLFEKHKVCKLMSFLYTDNIL